MAEITLAIAVLAGLGSFIAPCILPMVPAFLAYISGTTVGGLARGDGGSASGKGTAMAEAVSVDRAAVVLNAAFFVAGFSFVFAAAGVVINSVLAGSAAGLAVDALNQVGGAVIVAFGAYLLLSQWVKRLNVEKKLFPKRAGASYPMSFVFGLAFAAGWTPCVGPVLGTILALASTTPSAAFNLLLAYSLGLGAPFMLMAVFFSRATWLIRAMGRHLKYYSVVLGALIMALGALVFFNQLEQLASFPLLNELVLPR